MQSTSEGQALQLPEWFTHAVAAGDPFPPLPVVLVRVVLAFVLGLCVAAIYRNTLGRGQSLGTLPTTFVLLSVLIAVVAMVIGDNVARAFGLVGALSIVRFRTVVEDTRDTAFVIFSVAVGMAAGAGYLLLALVAVPAVGLSTAFMCWWDQSAGLSRYGTPAILRLRLALGKDPEEILKDVFERYVLKSTLTEVSTAKQGTALDLNYRILLKSPGSPFTFLAEVNRVEGVDSAEVKCTE